MTNIKEPDMFVGPVLTTGERTHRVELIMGQMYRLEMLHHRRSGRPSTQQEIDKFEAQHILNTYANAVLKIDPQFFEPVKDDVSTNPEDAREASDMYEDEIMIDELPVNVGHDSILPVSMDDD